MGPTLLALVGLAAAPSLDERYVLELASVPVAAIEVRLDGATLTYRAVHGFERDAGVLERTFELGADGRLDGGPVPEVLALARAPRAVGCREALEERSGRLERLCVDAVDAGQVVGTIAGEAFTARYVDDRLAELSVLGVRFVRSQVSLAGQAPRLLADGVPVAVGVPADARRVAVVGVGAGADGRCLDVARRVVAKDAAAALVLGLVEEDGRLWPHAWVRRGERHLDPTLAVDSPQLARRRYWALPPQAAGKAYLSLAERARSRAK